MPYGNSTQKDYGDNPLQKRSGFKMKSPLKKPKAKKVKRFGTGKEERSKQIQETYKK